MSVVIRISYSTEEELDEILELLAPRLKSYKKAKKQESQHKNAYIYLKSK